MQNRQWTYFHQFWRLNGCHRAKNYIFWNPTPCNDVASRIHRNVRVISLLTFQSLAVTVCLNIHKSYVLPTACLYILCVCQEKHRSFHWTTLNDRLLSRDTKIILYKTPRRPVVSCGAAAWVLTKKEEQAVLIFERKIFRRIFGPKYKNGEWKSRTNRELEEMCKGEK